MTLEDRLLELERRFLDPEQRRHPDRLADLLDDGFLEHGAGGRVYTKTQVLALLRAAPGRTFALSDFHARELAPGCALATFSVLADGSRSLRCSIWEQRGGDWRMVFQQGTPCPPIPETRWRVAVRA